MEAENNSTANKVISENCSALFSVVAGFYSKNEFCDVTIKVGNQCFNSHRLLLAAFSEFFLTMFQGNFNESRFNKDDPIILHDVVDSEAFELILHFMYFGKVINITNSNVGAVLIAVDFLKLKNPYPIETTCIELIRKNAWGPELIRNALKIFKLACVTNRAPLTELIREHICHHLGQLSTNDTFKNVSYEDVQELLGQGCAPRMRNQDFLLNFLIGWVHQFREERKHHFNELLKLVDFERVSPDCFLFLLNEYENVVDRLENSERVENTNFKLFSSSRVIDRAQSGGTITFVKDNFSAIKVDETFFSPPCLLHDFSWRISIRRTSSNFLLFCVWCDGTSIKEWSCYMTVELSILSQEKGRPDVTRKTKKVLFNRQFPSCGVREFIKWDDLLVPDFGLVKDNTVIFQAHMIAESPIDMTCGVGFK